MVQVLPQKQMSPFGQFVAGFGQGLSESLPKAIEQRRLAEGLRNLEQESANLTPQQQMTRLYSIPGVTPQMIESYERNIRNQSAKKAYAQENIEPFRNEIKKANEQRIASPKIKEIEFGPQKRYAPREEQEPIEAKVGPENPFRQEAQPVPAWTPEQKKADIGKELEKDPLGGIQAAKERSDLNEEREINRYKTEQEKDKYDRKQKELLDKDFTNMLETKLQKTNEGVFKDVTGEMLEETKQNMYRDLLLNPNKTPNEVAKDWSNRLLETAKTKNQLQVESSKYVDYFLPWKWKQKENNLKSYQKIFEKSGNLEEFSKILESDFGMSPQTAAKFAYPLSKPVSSIIQKKEYAIPKNVSLRNLQLGKNTSENLSSNARKVALEIEKNITDDDSILAIAKALTENDPDFDEMSFFEQLSNDIDLIGLNGRQKREIAKGKKDFFPNWGDVPFTKFISR